MADEPAGGLSSFYTVVLYFLAILYSLTFLICSFRLPPYLFIKKKSAVDDPLNRASIMEKNSRSLKGGDSFQMGSEPLVGNSEELPIVKILSDSSRRNIGGQEQALEISVNPIRKQSIQNQFMARLKALRRRQLAN